MDPHHWYEGGIPSKTQTTEDDKVHNFVEIYFETFSDENKEKRYSRNQLILNRKTIFLTNVYISFVLLIGIVRSFLHALQYTAFHKENCYVFLFFNSFIWRTQQANGFLQWDLINN